MIELLVKESVDAPAWYIFAVDVPVPVPEGCCRPPPTASGIALLGNRPKSLPVALAMIFVKLSGGVRCRGSMSGGGASAVVLFVVDRDPRFLPLAAHTVPAFVHDSPETETVPSVVWEKKSTEYFQRFLFLGANIKQVPNGRRAGDREEGGVAA